MPRLYIFYKRKNLLQCLVFLYLMLSGFSLVAQEYPFPMVLVVHHDNKTADLNKNDVIDIYMGRFRTFPDGSPVDPVDFPVNSVERSSFYKKLVGKSEQKINAYWSRLLFSGRAKPPRKAQSKTDVINSINVQTIAYIHLNDVTEEMKIVFEL